MNNISTEDQLRQRYAKNWERAESLQSIATVAYVVGFCILGISLLVFPLAAAGNHLQDQLAGAVSAPMGIIGGGLIACMGFALQILSGILMAVTDTAFYTSKRYFEGR